MAALVSWLFAPRTYGANDKSRPGRLKALGLDGMGMPKRLFQEITAQQSSDKVRLLDSGRLKALGLDGIDPAYEQWLRDNNQERLQSN